MQYFQYNYFRQISIPIPRDLNVGSSILPRGVCSSLAQLAERKTVTFFCSKQGSSDKRDSGHSLHNVSTSR